MHHGIPDSPSSSTRTAPNTPDLIVLAALAVSGWALWMWAESKSGAEAWDHDVFWSVVLPAMALLSAIAGFLRPRIARFAGVTLVVPQAITLFTTTGIEPLALVGILFFAAFALVFTGIAVIAANISDRFDIGRRF